MAPAAEKVTMQKLKRRGNRNLCWQPDRTFVGKIMSLLFNTLSRLVIAFLPWSKLLLISWLQSPSAVILETMKIKSLTFSTVSVSIYLSNFVLNSMKKDRIRKVLRIPLSLFH